MENPATWGRAEHVIAKIIDQDSRQRAVIIGWSLPKRIAEALRDEGLLPRDDPPPAPPRSPRPAPPPFVPADPTRHGDDDDPLADLRLHRPSDPLDGMVPDYHRAEADRRLAEADPWQPGSSDDATGTG